MTSGPEALEPHARMQSRVSAPRMRSGLPVHSIAAIESGGISKSQKPPVLAGRMAARDAMAVDRISRVPRPGRRSRDGGCGQTGRSSHSVVASEFLPERCRVRRGAVVLWSNRTINDSVCLDHSLKVQGTPLGRRSVATTPVTTWTAHSTRRCVYVRARGVERFVRSRIASAAVCTPLAASRRDPSSTCRHRSV
jgi:hypothetical protein